MNGQSAPCRKWRWILGGLGVVLLAAALFVWRTSPLPSAKWRVTEIRVDGNRVDPLNATIRTKMGSITFKGCNEMGAQAHGLPWHPKLDSTYTTEMFCTGPRGDLDKIWTRLVGSPITFDGAWSDTATLRTDSVEMHVTRAT
jgi:hypothetical protein